MWVPHHTRGSVVDYVRYWKEKTEILVKRLLGWIGVPAGTFYQWKQRYGKVSKHNGWVPRAHWLLDSEKRAILDFYWEHPLDGYRRLTYMMLDRDIVAVSPARFYRVLKAADVMQRSNRKVSKKVTGFKQPKRIHDHWHIDMAYLSIGGTFYYLCSILDGYSRSIVHWEIRAAMNEQDVETILQRAREKFPRQRPAICRQGIQAVRATVRHDACAGVALISAKQRQDRTLSPHHQRRVHSPWHAAHAGGR